MRTVRPTAIIRGINFDLKDATKSLIATKAGRLIRHEPTILRLRIDVERDVRGRSRMITAKGRIEIAGPDLTAAVTTSDAMTAVSLLVDKLDRMLRKRASILMRRRTSDDIRAHVALNASE